MNSEAMVFEVNDKVALVTGGVSGIGLEFAKAFLRNGARGVTLVDVNSKLAETVLTELEEEFGLNKVLFVKTDVSDTKQFEYAFKKTVETFKHIDILVNNAGICCDKFWQKEVAVNFNGAANGVILGIDNYLPKYKQGLEAVILNICSTSSISVFPCIPIYSATKAGIVQMTRVWGDPYHYKRSNVRVFAICPGGTETPLLFGFSGSTLGKGYQDWIDTNTNIPPPQKAKHVADEGIKLIKSCSSGTIWVVEEGETAFQYVFPAMETMKK